ncbi:MAG TPA: hypothetical protein VH370_15420 [Humisphaera sp.]|jgi:predicted transcriptional regulator|nr:hypothetical protein [Humisphaera sp.]
MGEVATETAKQKVEQLLRQLPDDCDLEDIQYRLYVLQTLENRMKAAEAGEFVSQEEAEKRMSKWILK